MEVKYLELRLLSMKLKEPFTTSFGTEYVRDVVLVKVVGEGGEVGWGEVVASSGPWYSYETVVTAWHVIKDFIAPLMSSVGDLEPREYPKVVSRIRGHEMAKAGVEYALWDLKGRLEGRSLKELFGGVRDRVSVGVSVGIKGSIEELIKVVSKYVEEGYGRVKLKIKPGWDVGPVKAVKKEFPDVPLQVDANASYELSDLPVLKELDKLDLLMIEQPLHYKDLVGHAKLAKLLKTPICLDESVTSYREFITAYELGALSILNLKPGRVGGITESLRIHELSTYLGVPMWVGGMLETGIGRAFLVALATLPNVRYPSDISASSRYWGEGGDIVEPPWTLGPNSTIEVPKGSGIGVEVLEDRIDRLSRKKLLIKLKTN